MKKLIYSAALLTAVVLSSCGGGPALCDCVNLDKEKADDKMKEACETMEKEWKEKYDKADDDAKKKMQEEAEACEKK